MKKNNLWRVIWIVGIYAVLILILYLVVMYKVKWEHKDLNTYLYFYDCSNDLCTSTYEQSDYYSSLLCEDDICPFIKEKYNDILVLSDGTKHSIYNYTSGEIISNNYTNYRLLNDENYIVMDVDGKNGVINSSGDLIVELINDEIIDYDNGFLAYKNNNKYGIVNNDNLISIDAKYDDVVLINDKIFAYKENDKYYIASYDSELPISTNSYDYIYSTDDMIMTFNENKVDILGIDLKSRLLIKIDSHYKYTEEKERDSLNIYKRDNFIYFNVYTEENKFIQYVYDLKNKRLI